MNVSSFTKTVLAATVALSIVVLCIFALVSDIEGISGVLIGSGLGVINLLAISWLCKRLVTRAYHPIYIIGFVAKFGLLIALVWVAVIWLPMDLIGFVAGLSASVVGIVVITAYTALRKVELEL